MGKQKQIGEMAKIKEYCGDCRAWSGTDCTRNPYAQGCLKEKIEEMAKDLYGHICGKVKCEDCKYHGDSEILSKYCDNYLRAKHLVEKGYRKIPDGGCVLDEKQNQNFVKFVMGEKAKTRKETAEKFAERLKETLCEFLDDNEDNNGKISKAICLIEVIGVISMDGEVISLGLIDEICKEITEGKV